jgi:hypothetical protein
VPEIKPDLSDESRCISVHWSLPVQCVLPCTHAENWHEAWHPNGNRIRYRRTLGVYRTEELHDGGWHDLEIPPPGEICGEPYGNDRPGVFCQAPLAHNQISWTHGAIVNGCRYTWNTPKPATTPAQVAQDLTRVRAIAAEQAEKITRLDEMADDLARSLWHIEGNYAREGSGPGSRFEGRTLQAVQIEYVLRQIKGHLGVRATLDGELESEATRDV